MAASAERSVRSLEHKAALVTGGSRGIGSEIARELARRGADVCIGFREDERAANAVTREIRALGGRATAIRGDVSDPSEARRVVSDAVATLAGLDIVVSNAGRVVARSFLETTPNDYEVQVGTNINGPFFITQAAAAEMIKRGRGGRIIHITSRAAHRPVRNLAAYCVTKAALAMLTKVAALELAEFKITVNAVAPGTTETDMNRDVLNDPRMRDVLLSPILLGGPMRPGDVAAATCFLASDEGAHITGCTIRVDGGASLS
jgi:NAD(P)-dependent dehydrogenase (short-subunit alcohol dehydrogenase family)